MFSYVLVKRVIACSGCGADNVVIGSEPAPGTLIVCSRCGRPVGRWADTHAPHTLVTPAPRQQEPEPLRPSPA